MKLVNKLFVIFLITFLFSVIPILIFSGNYEIRTKFYQIIFEGYLTVFLFVIILIILIIFGFNYLRVNKLLEGIILIFYPFVLLIAISYLFLLFKINQFGTFNNDLIIYDNINTKDRIIVQYIGNDFDGVPQHRILKIAADSDSDFRKFSEINLQQYNLVRSINFANQKVNCNLIPKVINYKLNNYKLKYCKKE